MNLLLTNDDGIASPGMAALIRELAGDHTLYVSAPDRQRSAAGASMTIRAELYATPYTFPEASWARCTEVNRPRTISCIRSWRAGYPSSPRALPLRPKR